MSSVTAFMTAAPKAADNGNTPWAQRYAGELRRVVNETAANAPRSLQAHLGPSELGTRCDRQVAGKLAAVPTTNHVVDPWASVIGTAVHAWLADAFAADNARHELRWVPEFRVTAIDGHSGTADLYDVAERAVVDHKCLGPTSMAKVRAKDGPPIRYQVQLFLYGAGYLRLGLPVERVVLAAYPRTSHTLDGLYVWESPFNSELSDALIKEVETLTNIRKQWANDITNGNATLQDVPHQPDPDECYFCPFYRPQAARDDGTGCPGTIN